MFGRWKYLSDDSGIDMPNQHVWKHTALGMCTIHSALPAMF